MMNNLPLISVIIPTYNREELLPKAMMSVISQTYKNWELLIVDDNSTDQTRKVVEQYASNDKRIKYQKNDRNKGPSGARNCGILHSKGEFIAFLDSDDEWFDYHLTDSLHTINNTGADVCFSLWVERRNEEIVKVFDRKELQNNLKNKMEIFETYNNAVLFDKGLFEHFLNDSGWFYHINTMVIRKSMIDKIGLLNEKFIYGEDSEYIVRFFDHSKIALINNPHFIYNQSHDSLYFFCDRSGLDVEEIFNNDELHKKLSVTGKYSNEFRLNIRKRILKTDYLENKTQCLENIESAISKKYLTLSILHKSNIFKALHYCNLSMLYEFKSYKLSFMFSLINPFKKIKFENIDLDLY